MEKKIFIGSTKPDTYDPHALPITLEIEIKEKSGREHFQTVDLTPITPPALCLSISGNIGSHGAGQINETLERLTLDNSIDYRPGWNADRLNQLLKVWERWHLNDIKAGCRHQNESKESKKKITIITPRINAWKIKDDETRRRAERLLKLLEMGKVTFQTDLYPVDYLILDIFKAARNGEVYKPKTEGEKSYFEHGIIEIKTEEKAAGWVYPTEHPDGMLTRPCPQCGYRYGSAWLFDALPQDVIDFIEALNESTAADLEDADKGNVRGFVRNHKIRIDVEKVPENKNAPDWKDANHYKTTLYFQGRRMTTYFSMGTAIKEEPTAADVLNSLAQDARTIEDYPDPLEWAGNLGYEAGTKAAKIFKATLRNTEALKKFLNEEYKALLEAEEL